MTLAQETETQDQESAYIYGLLGSRCGYSKEIEDEIMRGAVDIHVHAMPCTIERVWDEIEVARAASQAGMRALVFKCHHSASSARSILVQRAVDEWREAQNNARYTPLKVIGGVVLNRALGGINPYAVEASIKFGGKYVWMPTLDSEHHHRATGKAGPGITVFEDGHLRPEAKEVLKLVAENRQVLGLAHLSTPDRLALIDEARAMGVEKIVVDHPQLAITKATVEEQKEMVDRGALIGLYYQGCVPNIMNLTIRFSEVMRLIEMVGPQKLVVGTDLGQLQNPHPVEGMRLFIRTFLSFRVPKERLITMFQRNAARLLDLD
ncbi:MAG: hypothetical protein HYU86_02545 [Chloroflexi bacterium]|nr:hypothetical protein [Chloroflexota bacterium]